MNLPRYLIPVLLIAPVACALIAAPPALAGCSSSGDTRVCGQGTVRDGHDRAPVNHSANPFAPEQCRWTCNDNLFTQP